MLQGLRARPTLLAGRISVVSSSECIQGTSNAPPLVSECTKTEANLLAGRISVVTRSSWMQTRRPPVVGCSNSRFPARGKHFCCDFVIPHGLADSSFLRGRAYYRFPPEKLGFRTADFANRIRLPGPNPSDRRICRRTHAASQPTSFYFGARQLGTWKPDR